MGGHIVTGAFMGNRNYFMYLSDQRFMIFVQIIHMGVPIRNVEGSGKKIQMNKIKFRVMIL